MAERTWTCQHQAAGEKCGAVNPRRRQICQSCGKRRPATKRPAHRAIMDHPYEKWVAWFYRPGEPVVCMLCGRPPAEGKKLNRDHGHSGVTYGKARGLLCYRCTTNLPYDATVEWLRLAVAYLEAAEDRARSDLPLALAV
jgi:ribosomal protein L40E